MSLVERVKSRLVEAFQEKIEEINSFDGLEAVLEVIGLDVDVTITNGQLAHKNGRRKPTNGRRKHGRQGAGAKLYWRKIRKIAKENNTTPAEARVLYLRDKEGNRYDQKKKKPAHNRSGNQRKAQRKYWRDVNKIAAENKCTKSEARTLYKSMSA